MQTLPDIGEICRELERVPKRQTLLALRVPDTSQTYQPLNDSTVTQAMECKERLLSFFSIALLEIDQIKGKSQGPFEHI